MSSPCRNNPKASRRITGSKVVTALPMVALAIALLGSCQRERREYADAPVQPASSRPSLTTLQPGAPQPTPPDPVGQHYENNAFHVNEGSRWYQWFNCNGCHANGGGAIGPALMDAPWRYGGSIEQIYASIMDGRPNGMPAWRGKSASTK